MVLFNASLEIAVLHTSVLSDEFECIVTFKSLIEKEYIPM